MSQNSNLSAWIPAIANTHQNQAKPPTAIPNCESYAMIKWTYRNAFNPHVGTKIHMVSNLACSDVLSGGGIHSALLINQLTPGSAESRPIHSFFPHVLFVGSILSLCFLCSIKTIIKTETTAHLKFKQLAPVVSNNWLRSQLPLILNQSMEMFPLNPKFESTPFPIHSVVILYRISGRIFLDPFRI